MLELEDKLTIQQIKKGNIDKFEVLVKKYTSTIYRFIAVKLFNKDDVEDLVQNSFLSFYKAINRFDEQRPVLPYLYEIAKNEMKMYYRSRKNLLPLNEEIVVQEQETFSMDEHNLEGLLKKLSPDQQKALQLLAQGYSYEDIAKKMK